MLLGCDRGNRKTSEGVGPEQRALLQSMAAEVLMASRAEGREQNEGKVGVKIKADGEIGGDTELSELR